jgi:hypothetical protein
MKTLLSKLFPFRSRTVRKATRQARRPRLSIEKLDDRVLPSASSVLNNSILTITADNNGSNATFFSIGTDQWMVAYGDSAQTFSGPVNEVVFKGGAGNDNFSNQSSVNCLVIGSAGRDTYNGGSGVNLLDRNGNRVSWSSTSGQNVTFGLGDGSPTTDDLNATGSMMVSVSPANDSQLSIAGPSGIGFRLDAVNGQWQDSVGTDSSGKTTHTFKPSSRSLTLHTGSFLGDISLPGAGQAGLTIGTKGTTWADPVGEFNTMTIGPNLPLDTSSTSPTKFLTFGQDYGVDLKLPSLNWGLQLGSTLAATGGPMSGAPLNKSIPYFFVANSLMASATVGGYTAQVGTNIQFAFDPSDPFVYVAAHGIPTPEGPIDIAIGASINGRILFTPQIPAPSSVLGVPVPPPNIAGNVYLGGIIPLPDTPLAITGNMVVGLVHDVNGNLAAGSKLTKTHADALLQKKENLLTLIQSMTSQPTIGINGELDVGKDFLAHTGIVQMKLGNAVAYYVPTMTNPNPNGLTPADIANFNNSFLAQLDGLTYFGFHPDASIIPSFASGHAFVIYAQSANPFDGIPIPANIAHTFGDVINAITDARQFSLQGIVDSQKNWALRIDGKATGLFGFATTASARLEASSLTNKVAITAGIQAPFGLADLTLHGTLDLQTGDIAVFEKASVSYSVPGIVTLKGDEELLLSFKAANLQASAALDVSADAGTIFGVANLWAHAGVTLDSSHVLLNGNAELDLDGSKWFDASIDSSGITIAGHRFGWPTDGDLIADGPALVDSPAMLHFFVPSGITDPRHFSAALSPDGLAANYDAASTDPNASFTFAAPGTYTIYGRMYQSSGDVSDYQTPVTVYGSDQHDTYFVERLYHDLLGRASDSAGLAFYTGQLAHGASHAQVAGWFLHSDEYLQDVVQAAYHEMLGRFGEPAGLRGWVSFLQAGHTADELRVQIANSLEYSQHHGDEVAFVEGLYQDALGRMGTAAEVNYYTQVLAGGASRADVVQAFFASSEHQTRMTEEIYQKFLRRDADPSGLFFSTRILSQGKSDVNLTGSVLGSAEYAPLA